MKVFNYDEAGLFTFESEADPDPLQPVEWLFPARSTPKQPPDTAVGEYAVFDQLIDDWVVRNIPQPDIELVKQEKWQAITAMRDRLTQSGGYPVDGYWFHSDAYSLSQQQGLILAAMQVKAAGGDMDSPLISSSWKTMGGYRVPISAHLALRLLPAAMAQQGAIFEAAEAHREAMEASPNPASYDFSGGWPQVFGE